MLNNVKAPWEQRLSKIGEKAIEMRLLEFALTAKDEIDVGLDFYCHLLEDISPSTTYFGIQAKGTKHFDDNWGRGIEKKTIVFWLTRPFPVFLVVCDNKDDKCYWMSIEDNRYDLIGKLHKTNAETIYMKMDKSHVLEKGKSVEFVRKIKDDSTSVELFRGRPQFKGEGYVRIVPDAPRSSNELLLTKENIRQGMYSLVIYSLQQQDLETAKLYCDFLTKFDKSHYNHFLWLGLINKALGNKKEAKRFLKESLRMCESDKNWPKESMEKIIAYVKAEMENLNSSSSPKQVL